MSKKNTEMPDRHEALEMLKKVSEETGVYNYHIGRMLYTHFHQKMFGHNVRIDPSNPPIQIMGMTLHRSIHVRPLAVVPFLNEPIKKLD